MNDQTVVINTADKKFLYDQTHKKFILLFNGFTIGREAASLTIPKDMIASRNHCQFEIHESMVLLIDLKSSNGTTVNGKKINRRMLNQGDKIQVGNCEYVFSLHNNEEKLFAQSDNKKEVEEKSVETKSSIILSILKVHHYPKILLISNILTLVPIIMLAITNESAQDNLFYTPASVYASQILPFIVSLVLSNIFYFWLLEKLLKKKTLKNHFLQFAARTVSLLVLLTFVSIITIALFFTLSPAERLKNTNFVVKYCQSSFDIDGCASIIIKMAEDRKYIREGKPVEIIDRFVDESILKIKKMSNDKYNPETINELNKIREECKASLWNNQRSAYASAMKKLRTLLLTEKVLNSKVMKTFTTRGY